MAQYKEDPDHLTHLAKQFRSLARRTEKARYAAIGPSDFGPGNAHDPALNQQIDWFYRRWVQRVEADREYMFQAAQNLEQARETYKLADHNVQRWADLQAHRRQGADL